MNGTAYDKIAAEYYDSRHQTSRNFDQATTLGLEELKRSMPEDGLILEVGAGRGRSNEYLGVDFQRVVQLDNSKAMLNLEPRENCLLRVVHKAEILPFLDNEFVLVNAFLSDSYLGLGFLSEAYRVLKENGLIIGTTPAFGWGNALREHSTLGTSFAKFISKDKEEVVVTSNLIREEQLRKMLAQVGFREDTIDVKNLKLPAHASPVSPDIQTSADRLGISVNDLDIVSLFVGRKSRV